MFEVASAVTVLARGEVLTACSEGGALGSEGRVGGERRKEFLRMPTGPSDSCGAEKGRRMSIPLGRRGGEEICMVEETCVMFDVGENEAVD